MDNTREAVFEADSAIDNGLRHTPAPLFTPHTGQFAKLSYGRFDDTNTSGREQTPLLAKGFDDLENLPAGDGISENWPGEDDFKGLSWRKKPSVYWLLPPFLLFAIAFGGLSVPKVNLVLSMICQQYFKDEQAKDPTFTFAAVVVGKDNEQCRAPQISALVAKFSLYGNLIGGILTAISSPKLGAMSDRYGRLKIIAITTCGMFVGEVITIIAATWPNLFSVNWLLVGAATDGICGSFIAAMAVAHAYASDCTAPSKRAVTFGYFHGCLFGGIAVGPLISGYIIKATGTIITPFYIALCAHLIFISLLLFVLPESLTKERQLENREKVRVAKEAARLKRWNVHAVFQHVITGGGLFKPLQILWPTGAGSSRALRRNLFTLAAVDTIMFGVAMGSMSIVIIYSIFKFGWGTMEQSIFSSISSACRVGVLLLLLPLIGRIFRGKASMQVPTKNTGSDRLDLSIIHVAILFDLLGYVGYAVAMSGDMLMAAGALASVGGMGSPTLQSALTKHVPADRTGQLLGAMGLLHALAKVVAPTIFSLIYTKTVEGPVPQTVFICLAATFGLALLLSLFIRPHIYYQEQTPPSIIVDETFDEEVVIR